MTTLLLSTKDCQYRLVHTTNLESQWTKRLGDPFIYLFLSYPFVDLVYLFSYPFDNFFSLSNLTLTAWKLYSYNVNERILRTKQHPKLQLYKTIWDSFAKEGTSLPKLTRPEGTPLLRRWRPRGTYELNIISSRVRGGRACLWTRLPRVRRPGGSSRGGGTRHPVPAVIAFCSRRRIKQASHAIDALLSKLVKICCFQTSH